MNEKEVPFYECKLQFAECNLKEIGPFPVLGL